MCVQWEPEWKYAPQANALTWITKLHINSQHINAEDSIRQHKSIMVVGLYACDIMDRAWLYMGVFKVPEYSILFWGEGVCARVL